MTPLFASLASTMSVAQDEVDLGDALPDEGITTDQWITAGVTLIGFVVAALVLRAVIERVIRKTDAEGQIASFVAGWSATWSSSSASSTPSIRSG